MRVISGSARGLKLITIEGPGTRPTLDRVKEAIFSMLYPYLSDATCLDLFAGSGGLGIEAISRGSSKAVFVDNNPKCIEIIRKNTDKARLSDKSQIVNSDFRKYLLSSSEKFDIIFLDPPYQMDRLDEIFSLIKERSILNEDGIILLEADEGTCFSHQHFETIKHKTYGRVNIFILKCAQ